MLSYEINQKLESQNYNITPEDYIHICNTSPQIDHTKYDPYNETFHIWTNDNWSWCFKVKLRGEEEKYDQELFNYEKE
jgi:hypothetical protein